MRQRLIRQPEKYVRGISEVVVKRQYIHNWRMMARLTAVRGGGLMIRSVVCSDLNWSHAHRT